MPMSDARTGDPRHGVTLQMMIECLVACHRYSRSRPGAGRLAGGRRLSGLQAAIDGAGRSQGYFRSQP